MKIKIDINGSRLVGSARLYRSQIVLGEYSAKYDTHLTRINDGLKTSHDGLECVTIFTSLSKNTVVITFENISGEPS